MKSYTLYVDKSGRKKYYVYVEVKTRKSSRNLTTVRGLTSVRWKKVSFGAAGYSDFTKHRDVARRTRYRIRHKHDKIYDVTKPGFWSWWILWNKPTLRASLAYTRRKFKLKPSLIK
jgi:hypothetical protein